MSPRWRTVFFRPANAATAASLGAGLASGFLAISGRPHLAAVALVASGVADLLDGPIARRWPGNEDQTTFGKRIDSLADACNFGYAPAIFAYAALDFRTPALVAVLFLYHLCAVLRLAAFDTFGLDETADHRSYRGMPTTFAALFVPVVYCLADVVTPETLRLVYAGLYPVLGLAMISRLRIRKPGKRGIVLLLALAAAATWHLLHVSGAAS